MANIDILKRLEKDNIDLSKILYVPQTHFFNTAVPPFFEKDRGWGGEFRYDGRAFFSHRAPQHQDYSIEGPGNFTICPHCQEGFIIECNGPMVFCKCGKAFVMIGTELLIEDFDGCKKPGPCNSLRSK